MAIISGIKNALSASNSDNDDRGFVFSTKNRDNFVQGLHTKSALYNDPTYLGFQIFFLPTSPLLWNFNNTKENTARYYLNQIGEHGADMLIKNFSEILNDINVYMPWYWQSIEGLDQAWQWNDLKDPFIGHDKKIVINTLESIDLKISKVINMYREAAFDWEYRRERLPYNLRKFNMLIIVQELRKINVYESIAEKLLRENTFGRKIEDLLVGESDYDNNDTKLHVNNGQYAPWLSFELMDCEILPDESMPFLSELSMTDPQMASNKIVINYKNIKYNHGLGYEDLVSILNEAENYKALGEGNPGIWDTIVQKAKQSALSTASRAVSNLQGTVKDKIDGIINGLILGNVHEFSLDNIVDLVHQASIPSALTGWDNIHGHIPEDVDTLTGNENVNN